jgi:predicted RNase H-like nuclease (RuvC/YqgF family)
MRMAANKRTKQEEKEAIQKIKNQHANYKWIKYMFARQDELAARLEMAEKTVRYLSQEIKKIREELKEHARREKLSN